MLPKPALFASPMPFHPLPVRKNCRQENYILTLKEAVKLPRQTFSFRLKQRLQDDGFVVDFIFRSIEKRNGTPGCLLFQNIK